jgi:glycosyltransferase involved in cell wall biosynthesis
MGHGPTGRDDDARMFGVLVTYRQPKVLPVTLQRIAEQSQPLARLVVVDNAPSPEVAAIAEAHGGGHGRVEYVPSAENLGPAGGLAVGMERVLAHVRPDDWIVLLDDGDPPQRRSVFADLFAFGQAMRRTDPRTAGVGLIGARFDWAGGRLIRPPDEELKGPVPVDYIGGGQFPLYLAEAVRDVGPFSAPLFFGCDDLEYGLRLRRAGYSLYAPGDLWLQQRQKFGHTDKVVRPRIDLSEPTWRRYYSLRNTIHILRTFGGTTAAIRVTALQGLLKPLLNLATSPGPAWKHLELNLRACRDGWTGRLGRTVEPEVGVLELRSKARPSA